MSKAATGKATLTVGGAVTTELFFWVRHKCREIHLMVDATTVITRLRVQSKCRSIPHT